MRRPALVAVLLACLILAPAAGAGTLQRPRLSRIAVGPAFVPDRLLAASDANVPPGAAGGVYATAAGEHVTIYTSSLYPLDNAVAQAWAEFLGKLVHGPELELLTMYIAPPPEVTSFCGFGALACYAPGRNFLMVPGEHEKTNGLTPEAIVTHEYGHHIAAHRSNPPWNAGTWGTKRWATYIGVCRKTRSHQLFPGAEAALLYTLNPGEGFAETYRVLNERLLGVEESPWQIVDDSLYPTERSLSLLQEDVLQPWQQGPPATTYSGTLGSVRSRTFTIATPEDGTLSVQVSAASRLRVHVDVLDGATRLATGRTAVHATICGARTLRVRVTRVSGAGSFRLTVAAP